MSNMTNRNVNNIFLLTIIVSVDVGKFLMIISVQNTTNGKSWNLVDNQF